MPIAQSDLLFKLIKSLNKAEKRNFKLYVNRIQSNDDVKFLKLFDLLDKQDVFNEALLFKKMPSLKKSQFANLKRHLYKQICISLRLIHIRKNVDIEIREQLDFARILYGKGLYIQSLTLLERIKVLADKSNQEVLHMEILEFLKLIEGKHITRSRKVKNKMEKLIQESDKSATTNLNLAKLSNLKIKIHGLYITMGHVKNKKEHKLVKDYFESHLIHVKKDRLSFFEKVYLNQSYVWYYYILLDFPNCYKHALKWKNMFEKYPEMKERNPDLYMRGMHYVLSSTYNMGFYSEFCKCLKDFENFNDTSKKSFSITSEIISFIYIMTSKINKHSIEGSFKEGLELAPGIFRKLKKYELHLDAHRIMIFHYKIASLYFGAGNFNQVIKYTNKIINMEAGSLREDIQCFTRLLNMIAHYESGNYDHLDYLVQSVYRFLNKMKDTTQVHKELINFLKRVLRTPPDVWKEHMEVLYNKLTKLEKDPFERRSFLYLDINAWLAGSLQKRSFEAVVKEKFERDFANR